MISQARCRGRYVLGALDIYIADVLKRRDFAGKMSWADGRRYEGERNMYIYIHMHIHAYIHTYMHTYIHTFTHTYIERHTHIYIYTYI